jgi:hypothetical protein
VKSSVNCKLTTNPFEKLCYIWQSREGLNSVSKVAQGRIERNTGCGSFLGEAGNRRVGKRERARQGLAGREIASIFSFS